MRKAPVLLVFLTIAALLGGSYLRGRVPGTLESSDLCDYEGSLEEIEEEEIRFGNYVLRTGDVFSVHRSGRSNNPVFQFDPTNFVGAARAQHEVDANAGSCKIDQQINSRYEIKQLDVYTSEGGLEMELVLSGRGEKLNYLFRMAQLSDDELSFALRRTDSGLEVTNIALRFACPEEERVFGFGEQFNYLNMQGRSVPIWVQEQGIARGKVPDSTLVNVVSKYSSGDHFTTYAPVPYFITDRLRALVLENTEFSLFDFKAKGEAEIQVWSSEMRGRIYTGEDPQEVLEEYTKYAGRMNPLPDWAGDGAIVHVQGGSEKVREIARQLTKTGTPLAALWIEDWAGTRDGPGPRLSWNWQVDRYLYPDWKELVTDLREMGIRTLIYFNPYLLDSHRGGKSGKNLYSEAREKGYFISNRSGGVYPLDIEGPADAGMVDSTDEEAREWLKGLMKEQLENGVSGWMADYGEYLPVDAVLESGMDSSSYHNLFPVEWSRLNQNAVEEAGKDGEAVFFCRSGFTRSPSASTLFWLGDQNISWDRHDGLKTVVPALLSSGLSGFSLNHPDIGGYRSFSIPFFTYHRTKEMFYRWIELATFTAAFRTHSGSEPEKNLQVYTDDDVAEFFSRFARIFKELGPYRESLS
ncbi:MAG: alpha-glucosidase [Candidatus Acetothermia bacterium]